MKRPMRPTTIVALVIVGMSLWATGAAAQTVEEVIEKNLAAVGGEAAWKRVDALQRSGTMTGPEGQEAQVTTWAKRPNLMRQDVRIAGQTITTAFDGETLWIRHPQRGDEPQVLGDEAEEMAQVESSLDPPFLEYKARGIDIEIQGLVDVDGTNAHKLEMSYEGRPSQLIYVDDRTGMILRTVIEAEIEGQRQVREERLSDWREVDGIMLPFETETLMNGHRVTLVTLSDVKVNPRIDDSVFQP